ncbi:MAG: hypothetical protein ACK54K_18465, partial [Gemmatimonadaceae bacterium]
MSCARVARPGWPAVVAASLAASAVSLPAQTPTHPLDDISAREHWSVYEALQASGKLDSTFRLLYVGLKEPPKSEVKTWRAGQPIRREASVHLTQGTFGYEATVDIIGRKLLTWTPLPGKQYMTSIAEGHAAEALVLKDARVQAAFKRRGITDLTHVGCFPANNGYFDLPEERNLRVLHVTCDDSRGRISGYAEAFGHLVAVVDLSSDQVLRVIDRGVAPRAGPGGGPAP